MSGIPKLDKRDADELLNEVEKIAAQYVPEWNFDKYSSDVGVVFAKIFSKMMEGTISRYNKTSYNYYLTFLNMLGTKLRPAAAAQGMITVRVTEGSKGAYIEKGSTLFASADTEKGSVNYQTEDSLFAVDSRIESIFFTDPKQDRITNIYNFNSEDPEEKMNPFRIFDTVTSENLQKHEIYFYDDIVFDMKKSDITFMLYNSTSASGQSLLPEAFSDSDNVTWQYSSLKGWKDIKDVSCEEGGIRLKFDGRAEPYHLSQKTSRFIRCVLKKVPDNDIVVTGIKYKIKLMEIDPDNTFSGEDHLDKHDYFPFGEQYNVYNTFQIASSEAFTKAGAQIEILIDMQFVKIKIDANESNKGRKLKYIMSGMDFADLEPSDVEIERVTWEYWNGLGWSRLMEGENGEDMFKMHDKDKSNDIKRVLKFKCPSDIKSITQGSFEGYFIRARVTKMRNQFDVFANYITPYIHGLSIRYSFEGDGHVCKEIIVNSDMKQRQLTVFDNGPVKILKKSLCHIPAMYLCLNRPLPEGTIRMFIDIEEGIHRYNPPVRWEYCADDFKGGIVWKHIDVMDLTGDFSHSETITMLGRNDFKKTELFGKEGYFLRIVNPDGKYSDTDNIESRPIINNIIFNAVKIIQRDPRMPEYFPIARDEENKLCKLSYPDVAEVSVWINEINNLSVKEQDKFLSMPESKVRTKYDDVGNLESLWIKWKSVPTLVCCEMYDRVYEVDYSKGEILFGNGKNGKIPPSQYSESIRIEYSICNGSKGNIGSEKVEDFIDSIHGVDKVTNLSPIMGGVDMETIDRAATRKFGQVSGGNRLVSLSDFQDSICANDRNIYKIRCMSHVNEDGENCVGVTSIAVLPRDYMQGYEKFQGIKNRIWGFIDEKAPITMAKSSKIRIFEVSYVETCINIDIAISDFNDYQQVHKGIREKLKEFLNPVSGNFSRKGWDIGEFPRKEFIYNYIKTVKNIKWIKKINIFTKVVTMEGKKEISFEEVKKKKFVVPVFGEPEINVSVE